MQYVHSFRRHWVDMHIDDRESAFLSEFDPQSCVNCLKTAKIQNAMAYFPSHVGLCYYLTESGKMRKALIGREGTVRRPIRLCHEAGITVFDGSDGLLLHTVPMSTKQYARGCRFSAPSLLFPQKNV